MANAYADRSALRSARPPEDVRTKLGRRRARSSARRGGLHVSAGGARSLRGSRRSTKKVRDFLSVRNRHGERARAADEDSKAGVHVTTRSFAPECQPDIGRSAIGRLAREPKRNQSLEENAGARRRSARDCAIRPARDVVGAAAYSFPGAVFPFSVSARQSTIALFRIVGWHSGQKNAS